MNSLKYDDVSLFIGLTSCPFDQSPYDFYKKQFGSPADGLFANTKKSINQHFKDKYTNSVKDKLLYKPKGYCVFGKFDILLLSLIDDISFSTRSFKPFTHHSNKYFNEIYEHQSYYTLTPDFSTIDNKTYFNFFNNYTKLFEDDFDGNYPFISFTQLKLNPALLIGNGQLYLDLVYKYIKQTFDDKKIHVNNIHPLILESLGSHEINVLLFSNSVYESASLIKEIRELNINSFQKEFSTELETIKKKSLLANWLSQIKETSSNINNDLFVDTVSCVGYSLSVNTDNIELSLKDRNNVKLHSKWYLKPGHNDETENVIQSVTEKYKTNELQFDTKYFCIGQADLVMELPFNLKLIEDLFYNNRVLPLHVRETYSQVLVNFDKSELKLQKPISFNVKNHLIKKYIITYEEVRQIEALLHYFNAPSVLIEKILSICNLFNTLMIEPIFYASFIELFHFIKKNILNTLTENKKILNNISNGEGDDLPIEEKISKPFVLDILRKNVRIIDEAFYNRFFQSHKTNDITDINLDYKGSVRQIISSYDSIYKLFAISFLFDKNSPKNNFDSLVYISDESVVKSYSNSLLINFQHLFQPYIFCSSLIHEACNFYIHKFYNYKIQSCLKESTKTTKFIKASKEIEQNLKYFNNINLSDFPYKALKNEFVYVNLNDILLKTIKEYLNTVSVNIKGVSIEIFERLIIESVNENKKLIHYFLVDALTFTSAFHGNIEQYIYWHILYLEKQVNDIYNDVHKVDNKDIIINMFRLAFVINCFKEEIKEEIKIKNIELYEEQKEIFLHIKNIMTLFESTNEAKEFIKLVQQHSVSLYKMLYGIEYKNYNNNNKLKNKIEDLERKIKDGKICDINNSNDIGLSRLNTSLYMASFINVAHEFSNTYNDELLINSENRYHKVIRRNTESDDIENIGQINEFEINKSYDVTYDSLGGFFNTTPKIRKKIQLVRTSFYKTTWNFSQIYKKEYFSKP